MQIKDWQDPDMSLQRWIAFAGIVDILLLLVALSDLSRRTPEEIKGSKNMWTLVVFVDFIGPGAYFLFGRRRD